MSAGAEILKDLLFVHTLGDVWQRVLRDTVDADFVKS